MLGACSVGAQVATGSGGGLTFWLVAWGLVAMSTFAGGTLVGTAANKKKTSALTLTCQSGEASILFFVALASFKKTLTQQ